MPIKRSQRMQILIDMAKQEETKFVQQLAHKKAKVDADKKQLSQLQEYAAQYESERNLLGLDANLVVNYQHFVARLEQAIQQQNNLIVQSERQVELAMEQWLSAKAKTKSMSTLQNKHIRQENQLETKQEQRQNDEFAARLHFDRNI